MDAIRDVHAASYGTFRHRRVHAELLLGQHLAVSHGRVERLMRGTGLQGVHRRRLRGCTRRDQAATPSHDLVERNFRPGAFRTGSTSRTSPSTEPVRAGSKRP